jgi:hypothetical protein
MKERIAHTARAAAPVSMDEVLKPWSVSKKAWAYKALAVAFRHRAALLACGCFAVSAVVSPTYAHAGGFGLDFSDITSSWPAIKTFMLFLGGAVAMGLIIFGVIKGFGRDWGEMFLAIAGGLVVGFITAHAAGWINSETGQGL